ncbi:MAG TPA: HAMP domain-containing sensor histidine kinase [Acidimicrobiales bacterium]|nr:HAMP domain-containing sensor histidine kinase [Acidimicrobiales bacterium]
MSRRSDGSRRPIRLSFRTRLALVAASAVGVAVALASVASFFLVRHQLLSQVDADLRRQAVALAHTPIGLVQLPDGTFAARAPRTLGGLINFQVVRDDGTIYPLDTNKPIPASAVDRQVAGGQLDSARHNVGSTGGSDHLRILTIPAGRDLAVQLAYPLSAVDHTLRDLGLVLLAVALAGIALALGLGYLVAQAALRPVQRLTAAAEHVAATQQLDATIEGHGHDELGRLAGSFNAMLTALGASRRQQTQLVADAGHELRTPLTSLRTNIEVLAKVPDLPESDRGALLADVTGQLEELTTLVGDLVELARDEDPIPEPQDVRLDLVVERALERARRLAPFATFDADIQPGLVRGQPVLLERAVLNLLDNAVKWSPPRGRVEVGLHRNGAGWQLDVRDHGPGISADDLPLVFDRFYRSAAARALPGSGLGLAIVRQVVESHGGTVTAGTASGGGALLSVRLPAE